MHRCVYQVLIASTYCNACPAALSAVVIYVCNGGAIAEGIDQNVFDTASDRHGGELGAILKRGATDTCYTVGDNYAFKIATVLEDTLSDARYTATESCAFKLVASIEGMITNARYAVGDNYAFKVA